MIEIVIPHWKNLRLEHLVLDLNGTLAIDGVLIDGVAERLAVLRRDLTVNVVSSDTQGTLAAIGASLGVETLKLRSEVPAAVQKEVFVRGLGRDSVAAIGNGANDVRMLRVAGLSIVVLQREGTAVTALRAAQVATTSIVDALDLLIERDRLIGTLRA